MKWIPAFARIRESLPGKSLVRHSRESGNPIKNERCQLSIKEKWIPVFTGMTEYYPQSDLGTIKVSVANYCDFLDRFVMTGIRDGFIDSRPP